jgi:hypothetical protein
MLRPPFKPLAPPLGVAPHSLRTTEIYQFERLQFLKCTLSSKCWIITRFILICVSEGVIKCEENKLYRKIHFFLSNTIANIIKRRHTCTTIYSKMYQSHRWKDAHQDVLHIENWTLCLTKPSEEHGTSRGRGPRVTQEGAHRVRWAGLNTYMVWKWNILTICF